MPTSFFEWVAFFVNKYGLFFIQGAGTTIFIASIGTIAGFAIGLAVAVVRTIPVEENDSLARKLFYKFVRFIFVAYIEIFRGTPMIVQAMVIYYGSAELWGLDMSPMVAALFIVSINTGAYMAEIARGGIISIDKGQYEAAQSIGMTHSQTMVNIILPQAIRNILPSIGNEFVVNIKDTSVLNVISVTELFFMSKSAAGTYMRYFEVFFITCLIYFVLTFSVTRLLLFVERKLEGPDSFVIHGSQTVPQAVIKGGRE
ncbi:amino acid ABC transporter permease [Flexilinea flocculi]|jgi:putative lysine transport system permease protein|uniref:Amine acid ABC transporter, permease protein, 3-TM region, His/Glu/Gln/Arg/opine family n=1 Tax=Flexilinea flocculi TaxID=1678840 RepID=A0A0S7BVH4_9CHLR|nr:amino acid ABC transporter permease [Flexilinea flocculi]NMB92596.1 amino acid ABC transporter permease [Flexilinea flocculi]GAP41188.1 amine acid ABC transporter, permease protein, 3-TM region, His/Glu/Gln/Arg/opine family [Flexilinea flocculi]